MMVIWNVDLLWKNDGTIEKNYGTLMYERKRKHDRLPKTLIFDL